MWNQGIVMDFCWQAAGPSWKAATRPDATWGSLADLEHVESNNRLAVSTWGDLGVLLASLQAGKLLRLVEDPARSVVDLN